MAETFPGTFIDADVDIPNYHPHRDRRYGRAVLRDQPDHDITVEVTTSAEIIYAHDNTTGHYWFAGSGSGRLLES